MPPNRITQKPLVPLHVSGVYDTVAYAITGQTMVPELMNMRFRRGDNPELLPHPGKSGDRRLGREPPGRHSTRALRR